MDGYITIEKARNKAPLNTAGLEYTVSNILQIDSSLYACDDDENTIAS